MSQFDLSSHVNKNNMFLVNLSELEERLDPKFYQPIFSVSNKNQFKKLAECSLDISHPPEYQRVFSDFGIQLIRSQNVRPLGISLHENPVYFSTDFLKDKKHYFAKKGDILVVRSGVNAGDVAVVEKDIDNAIIGADTLLCRCSDMVVPKFLQVYFYTNLGKTQILKHTTGATNKHLNSENLKKVLIPNLEIELQVKLISIFENRLTLSKQKEQQAQALLAGIDAYLLAELGITLPQQETNQNTSFLIMRSEIEGRFDPHQFHFERVNTIKAIGLNNPVVRLHELVKSVKKITTQIDENDVYIGLENIIGHTGEYVATTEKQTISSASLFKKGQILFPKLRPYLNKVFLAEFDGICSTEFHVFETINLNAAFLAILLRSVLVVNQTKHLMTGNTLPRLQTEDINNLIVPVVPLQKQDAIVKHISHIRSQAKQLQSEATQILADAKAEVERLILGEQP